ncbi:Hsp20/alpha crystallin family protein [Natronosalvus vescus]|uniref:Hsp20/alpha crystallin family protein n=1 Tax=Natronosalvus vescus TaxID=2953881 RepID=UPI0020903B74|nr:Hsp20/alpha crystallin family protein [Natronosalvus vescus]
MAPRSNPFDALEDALRRLRQELETAYRAWNEDVDTRGGFGWSMQDREPMIDIADHGDSFVVTVDVPGYDSDDLDIRLGDRTLHISGSRERSRSPGQDGHLIKQERQASAFDRHVSLPAAIDPDDIDATLNNGVLTITLEKATPTDDRTHIDID